MKFAPLLAASMLGALTFPALADPVTLTIATVNNGDMIRMQKLTDDFTKSNPDINLQWVTLEENILRERVTTDIATGGGQYDIMTIGNYEVPIWGKQSWLTPLEFDAAYDVDDLLPAIRGGLTVDGKLYAAPFYGESAMVMYRTDLFEAAGLTMPESPTWEFVADAARKITNRDAGINGMWPAYEAALKANRIAYQMFQYPGTQHGFHNDTTPRFSKDAAALAWQRTVDHFKKHLTTS